MAPKTINGPKATRQARLRQELLDYLDGLFSGDTTTSVYGVLAGVALSNGNSLAEVADQTLKRYLETRLRPSGGRHSLINACGDAGGNNRAELALAALKRYLGAHPELRVGQALVQIRGGILEPSNREIVSRVKLLLSGPTA